MNLLRLVGAQRQPLALLSRCLVGVGRYVPVQQGALHEAASAVRAGEHRQGEVGQGVPEQGAQGQLREVTDATVQGLQTHVAQQVVPEGLPRTQNTNRRLQSISTPDLILN